MDFDGLTVDALIFTMVVNVIYATEYYMSGTQLSYHRHHWPIEGTMELCLGVIDKEFIERFVLSKVLPYRFLGFCFLLRNTELFDIQQDTFIFP